MLRILFVTDTHAATIILNKAINAVHKYNISHLIIAGDITGKELRPIIDIGGNNFDVNFRGKRETVTSDQLPGIKKNFEDYGYYFFECDELKLKELQTNEGQVSSLIEKCALDRLENWLDTLLKRIDLTSTCVMVTPGNDDSFELDSLLNSYEKKGIFSTNVAPDIFQSNEIITIDHVPHTQWSTPRELSERQLKNLISEKVNKLNNPEKAIFNIHCPPYNTQLDLVPELDNFQKRKVFPGGYNYIHVGSTAVRECIENFQPLLGLHGHIHESSGEEKIGKTVCLNPGTEYKIGGFSSYIVEINNDGTLARYFRVEG